MKTLIVPVRYSEIYNLSEFPSFSSSGLSLEEAIDLFYKCIK